MVITYYTIFIEVCVGLFKILLLLITFLKENLQIWFINIGKQIEKISMEDELVTSRKITQIIKALDEVQGINCFHTKYLICYVFLSTFCY